MAPHLESPRVWTSDALRVRVNSDLYAKESGQDLVLKLVWSDSSMRILCRKVVEYLIDQVYKGRLEVRSCGPEARTLGTRGASQT